MVMKKKGFYFGLLLALFGASGALQAYNITITNQTPYKIDYQLDIPAWLNAPGKVAPGNSVERSDGKNQRAIRSMRITIIRDSASAVKVKWEPPRGQYLACGHFTVSGSDKVGYSITGKNIRSIRNINTVHRKGLCA